MKLQIWVSVSSGVVYDVCERHKRDYKQTAHSKHLSGQVAMIPNESVGW